MTRKEQNKILNDKIKSNNNQYKIDRLNAEISAFSSGDLNKYEKITRKDLNYEPNALDKARFEFSLLGRAFNEVLDKTIPNYQEEGVIKSLKEIRDNLAGRINIPAGLIISPPAPPPAPPPKDTRLSFDDINKIKESMLIKTQELDEIKKRIGIMFFMSDDLLKDSIHVEEMLLATHYDIIRRLNNELKHNNLSVDESKKITDDIVEEKKKVLGRKQKIYDFKKVLEKRIKTD